MSKADDTKKASKTKTATDGKGKKLQIKFKKPSWENIKSSKVTKYSLLVLIILVCFVLVDFGVQYLNNDFSVAVVNGVRITRSDFYYRLNQSYGSAIASQLIEEEIVKQEAKNEGITATDEEIQAEVDDIATQLGGEESLNTTLDAYGLTLEDLKEQIVVSLLIEKILTPTIEYTEEDIKEYFDTYSSVLFADETAALEDGELLDYDTYRDETLEAYLDDQISNAQSTWLSGLEEDAKIQNNVTDKPSYQFLGATRNIISNMLSEANSNSEEE